MSKVICSYLEEKCKCGNQASHKVEESLINSISRHPFTVYLCCKCFINLFGPIASELHNKKIVEYPLGDSYGR